MNPLLPEPMNNLGRNVSFTAKPATKTDSQDATRFSETLKENTPQKRKTSEAAEPSRAPEKNATRQESRTRGKDDGGSPEKSPDTAKAPVQEKEKLSSGKQLKQQTDAVPDAGPVPSQEPVQAKADENLQLMVPVSESSGVDAGADKTVESIADSIPSLLQAGQDIETVHPSTTQAITGQITGQAASTHPAITQPESQAVMEVDSDVSGITAAPIPATPPAESLTQAVQPDDPETSALPGVPGDMVRQAKPAGTGTTAQMVSSVETAAPKPLEADAQTTFTAFETDLDQPVKAVDKNAAPEKPAVTLNMANAGPAPQPGYVKSNLDWRFGTGSLATDAELAREGSGLSAAATSPAGAAHAAISVTPMQFHDLAADQRVQMPVNIKFGQPEWAGMVAERTAMMSSQKISVAELQLDPPELGPLHVKVTVHHDQASVNFVSASPAVRDSLEQTAVRLRELLDQQGLDLVDVNVSDQSDRQQYSGEQGDNRRGGSMAGEEEPAAPGTVNHVAVVTSGIDHYA